MVLFCRRFLLADYSSCHNTKAADEQQSDPQRHHAVVTGLRRICFDGEGCACRTVCPYNLKGMASRSTGIQIVCFDMLIERIYEDNVLGKISDERFYRMSANYEKEQKELLVAVEHDEQAVRKAEQEKIDLKVFLEAIRECTDLKELTPTIVNTLIKRIEVHNSEKGEDGLKHVPVDISFTAVGIINIPTEKELIAAMEEMRENPLKSA